MKSRDWTVADLMLGARMTAKYGNITAYSSAARASIGQVWPLDSK